MCRFLAYIGAPIVMDKLLYQPVNSLIHQSYHARERRDPVNADGFGVGWYMPEIDPEPVLFTSIQPAWHNRNLRSLAPRTRSGCIFAHVRAAGTGEVSPRNCHPFQYQQFLMMHNGDIGGFHQIKRDLRERLADEFYDWIKGETDSEYFFALFLDNLFKGRKAGHHYSDIVEALLQSIRDLKELLARRGVKAPSYLNLAVTNGQCLIVTRYITGSAKQPPTLYHTEGSCFEVVEGIPRMVQSDNQGHAILVASEKLTEAREDWQEVPRNHLIAVTEDLRVPLLPIVV